MSGKKTILVIDDNSSVLQILDIFLTDKGYQILTADNGLDGIKMIQDHHPDGIILDLNLPKMSGQVVAELISKDPELKDIPVLLLTGTTVISEQDEDLISGVSHQFSKPISQGKLLATLDEMTNRSTRSQT
tara:strand:- start:160 stop:552 length:393 start_codon:yes stop_codon:yes gene_type:complete